MTSTVQIGAKREPDYESLERADWTFRDANTRSETHGIHPYPAKFIPQIPRTLIAALYPGDGTTVLDPFCGSGTTLLEAALAGVPAIGIDLHPLACLISKVKVTPLRASLVKAARKAVERSAGVAVSLPEIPALAHWFREDISFAIAGLVQAIDAEDDEDTRDALRIALSSILVRVSRQESDTRYAAVEHSLDATDVTTGFLAAARNVERSAAATWAALSKKNDVRIINKDILAVTPADVGARVSLVVSSPPYPNAYEYWLYHKYRMYWLGMDPIAVREKEIGARPHYFKKNPQTAGDFESQIRKLFRLLHAVVVSGGHACFQVGNSVIRGEPIDNAEIFSRVAGSTGFELVAAMKREIPKSRKAFNLSHARINEERILVFRRGDI
jgi:DNA modification methylase